MSESEAPPENRWEFIITAEAEVIPGPDPAEVRERDEDEEHR